MNKIKICLVGIGSIGRRHLRLLSERDDVLLCVVDPSAASKEHVASKHPGIVCYDSMDEAIAAEKPDAMLIATPHQMHSKMAIDALNAGLHVFCEKPMSDSMEDCVKMLECAKKSNKVFSVGFMFRFDPFIRKIKELIDNDVLGNIVHYNSRFASYNILLCSVTKHQENTPYSLVMDCIHDTDLLHYLTGSVPDYVYSHAMKAGNLELSSPQNLIDSLYRWEDKGVSANVHFNYIEHPQVHTLEILGDKGFVKGDFADGSIILGTRADNKIEHISAARDFDNVYREQLDHFIRAIRGEVEPENKAESAIMSTLLMQAQKEAAMCGHEVNIHEVAARYGFEY